MRLENSRQFITLVTRKVTNFKVKTMQIITDMMTPIAITDSF